MSRKDTEILLFIKFSKSIHIFFISLHLESAIHVEKSREILKQFWGFDSFRPLQEDIVDAVIYGHDALAILPTGGGKSICFQVPGIALEGITLVVSPLIALMQDQVEQLQRRGIEATMITSALSYREIDIALDNARFGNTKFLYTSPERLKSDLFIERFKRMKVGLIVVDEAHCISEWGQDFRPSYQEIATIRAWHPQVPMIALTASATPQVREDIVTRLELRHAKLFEGSLDRKNIHYGLAKTENKIGAVIDYCKLYPNQTGIVYCQTRRSVKQVVTQLRAHQISAGIYHGGMSSEDRSFMLQEWLQDRVKVMVATNAFGMGIDKPNVRYVLHYELPNNLEAYYQEAGRAGRDGNFAIARGYWNQLDLEQMEERLIEQYPERDRILSIYNSIANFLTVAIGSGKDETYPFNLQAFCNTFEVSAGETYYALRILQLNGYLNFTEQNFFPTRLKIVVGNKALYAFQVSHEKLASLIALLTRSYAGIFDRFISIHEGELSKRLKINQSELTQHLKFMEQYGVIDVQFQSRLPMITFLQERLSDMNFRLLPEIYTNRKEREIAKLNALKAYVKTASCRSATISEYFGADSQPCGICDNCIQQGLSSESLPEMILGQLPATFPEIEARIQLPAVMLQDAIRKLMREELVHYEEGRYFAAS